MKGLTFLRTPLLVATKCERDFLFLGYPLRLSATEAKLLHRLLEEGKILREECEETKNSLSVRICAINKKAYRISGRRLIIFDEGEYRLNPYA